MIENTKGEILLVRKLDHYAYAIPWCRITPGESLQECIRIRVKDLTGLSVHPVFLGPNEHIEEDSHFISFDHIARVDDKVHHYTRDDLEYLWMLPGEYHTVPLVPLTQNILERYCRKSGVKKDS